MGHYTWFVVSCNDHSLTYSAGWKEEEQAKEEERNTVSERFLTCKSSSGKLGLRLLAVSAFR
jgi:hypothetical protein